MDLCSVLPCTHGSCAIFRLQKNRKRLVAQRGLSCASAMKKRDGCFKPASPCPSPRLPAQPASHAAACRRARVACPGCPDQPADLLDGGAWSMASRRCPFESLPGFSANAAVAAPARCSPAIGPHGWKGALAFPDTVNSLMPWRRCGGAAFLALQVCRYDHQTCEQHESSLGGQAQRCAKGVSAIEPWRNCPFARTPPRAAWRVRVVCSAGAARPRKACPAPGSKSGARGGLSAWSSLL